MENSTPARKPSKALVLSVAALVLFGGGAFAAESSFQEPTVAANEAVSPVENKTEAVAPATSTEEVTPVKSDDPNANIPKISLTEDLVIEGGSGVAPVTAGEASTTPAPAPKKVSIASLFSPSSFGGTVFKAPVAKSYSAGGTVAPSQDAPAEETPSTPAEETTGDETLVPETPTEEAPATEKNPVVEEPVNEEPPVEEEVPSEEGYLNEPPRGEEISEGGPVAPEPELNEPPRGGEVSDGGPVAPAPEEAPVEEAPVEEAPTEEAPTTGGVVDEEASYIMIEFTSNTSSEVFAAWNGDYSQIENFEGNPSSSSSIQRVDADTSLIRWSAGNYVSEVLVSSNDMSSAYEMMTTFHNNVLAEMKN